MREEEAVGLDFEIEKFDSSNGDSPEEDQGRTCAQSLYVFVCWLSKFVALASLSVIVHSLFIFSCIVRSVFQSNYV